MESSQLTSVDRKSYVAAVGEILVKNHGKKKFYSPEQVKKASKRTKYDADWHCWAMCVFSSPASFNAYHESAGENCDYASMKGEMASLLTDGQSESWFDLDLSWLERPDIESPYLFDFFD